MDPPPWYRQFVADAVAAFCARLPGLPPVSSATTVTSPDEGVDVSTPPDVPVTKVVKPPSKLVKHPKRSVPDDELSADGSDGNDTQSVGARSTKRRSEDSDAETPEALTLTNAKRWAYQNLGQDLLASTPVAAHELDPCDLGYPLPVELDFGALPLSSYEAKALVRHNRVMQAIDKEVLDPEVDCS